jgi:hypothetical protein
MTTATTVYLSLIVALVIILFINYLGNKKLHEAQEEFVLHLDDSTSILREFEKRLKAIKVDGKIDYSQLSRDELMAMEYALERIKYNLDEMLSNAFYRKHKEDLNPYIAVVSMGVMVLNKAIMGAKKNAE